MALAKFRFISDASGGDQFTVVGFTGNEAISSLYRYEIEIKAPLELKIDLDDVLDSPASFITELDGEEYPVYGVLSSFDEVQTAQEYVYYRAVLVPRLWWLSIYKTNEIYTEEKTVDKIIQEVLENADFTSGTDFDLSRLTTSLLLERDYVCQFGESDFDFISRLMENEGIFYYFDHDSGTEEKIIFIHDAAYMEITEPDLIFEIAAQTREQHDSINAWSCRKQRLPESVTVRDFNPAQPSLDISDTMPIDAMGQGTEYIYGENVQDDDEATYLSEIRAEERLCTRTRYYGESSVTRLQAGYVFALDGHPNILYNGVEYLTIEVSHEGQHLDMTQSSRSREKNKPKPQYRNNFVAIESTEQYRPPRKTPKPRFYGTMTAFIYAESETKMNAEIDDYGRYRVQLPFDRADGTMESTDADRKASTWMRMAQPYVGQEQGMYFPLAGGTEVLLTFINGDPDQPIISSALANASQPSLLTSENNLQRTITAQVSQNVTGNTHNISLNSAAIALLQNPPPAPDPTTQGTEYINEGGTEAAPPSRSMLPPWGGLTLTAGTPAYDASFMKFMKYDEKFVGTPMSNADLREISTDRGAGDNYVYANARTFAYPQHERVYFIGTFHEDFHVKDDFLDSGKSWTCVREQYNFPEPGELFPDGTDPIEDSDATVNPSGVRGVSEDKRWGDQMTYSFGRQFNWAGGNLLGDGGSFGVYNYGNGYTENLLNSTSGTSDDLDDDKKEHHNNYKDYPDLNDNLGNISVDKTYGRTYSYQNGFSLDVKVGESHSEIYGNSVETVHGASDTKVMGATNDMFLGAKNEMNLDVSNSTTMGLENELFIGGKIDTTLAGVIEFAAGVKIEGNGAAEFELKNVHGKIKLCEMDTETAACLKSVTTHITTSATNIKTAATQIKSGAVSIGNKALELMNSALTMIN